MPTEPSQDERNPTPSVITTLLPIMAVVAVAYLVTGIAMPGMVVALTGVAVSGLGYALVYPGLGVVAVESAPPQSRGAAETKGIGYKVMRIINIGLALFVVACLGVTARAQRMEISPRQSRPAARGAAETFTGTVSVTPLFSATDATRGTGGEVTFEPGARSAWHTHPAGQTLVVTSGLGWVQRDGGSIEEVRPGDVVWFP